MTAFTSSDDMRTLRTLMGLGGTLSFSDFFAHVKMWAKSKPTDGTTYGITPTGYASVTSLPGSYDNSQNGWTYNTVAASRKTLRDFIGYDHDISGPCSGASVNDSDADDSSSGYFTFQIQLYASTTARISLADILGTSAKLGVYCVGVSNGETHSYTSSGNMGASGTLTLTVPTSGWTDQDYYVYPFLYANSTYYTIPTISRSRIEVTRYTPPAPYVTGVTFSGYSGAVQIGQSFTLCVYETYSDGTVGSTDIAVAGNWRGYGANFDISGTGTFTGKAVGSNIEIEYLYDGTWYTACLATVEAVPVTLSGITISGYSGIRVGGSFTLLVTAHYSDNSTENVTSSVSWSGYSSSILSRSGSTFTGLANGSTAITASYGGKAATQSVTVSKAVSKVELSFTELEMEVGDTHALPVATVTYSDGSTDHDVTWSENSNALGISNGNLVASAQASDISVVASAQADSSKKATLTVQVTAATPVVTVQSIYLSPSSLSLTAGGSAQSLVAYAIWSDNHQSQISASDLTWTMHSGSSYASVSSSGVVTPVAHGDAVVWATGKSGTDYAGLTGRCNVSVAAAPSQDVPVTDAYIHFGGSQVTQRIDITPGGSVVLDAECEPSNATIYSYRWSASPARLVTLSGNTSSSCTVTGRSEGDCTITLEITDTLGNEETATAAIRVDESAM